MTNCWFDGFLIINFFLFSGPSDPEEANWLMVGIVAATIVVVLLLLYLLLYIYFFVVWRRKNGGGCKNSGNHTEGRRSGILAKPSSA